VHLGIAKDLLASIIIQMLEEGLLGPGAPDVVLKALTATGRKWCRDNGLNGFSFTFSKGSLGRGSTDWAYPCVDTRLKAANTKLMAFFVAHLTLEKCSGTATSKLRNTCMWGLVEMLHVFDNAGRWLSHEQAAAATYAGNAFLKSYQRLAVDCLLERKPLYKIRPKTHYACHQIDDIARTRLNPRCTALFRDEDFVGKIAGLASRTHGASVCRRAIERYMLYLAMRWEHRRRSGKYVLDI